MFSDCLGTDGKQRDILCIRGQEPKRNLTVCLFDIYSTSYEHDSVPLYNERTLFIVPKAYSYS